MGISARYRDGDAMTLSWNELTGAIGDSVTVLPIMVAVALLSDLSLAVMLIWFGVFQIIWGLYYGIPISIEPMKALAALIIAGSITTGELVVAGLLLGLILLATGAFNVLSWLGDVIGSPVVRGIQLGVALVLLETGTHLGLANLEFAGIAVVIALGLIGLGYWNLSAFGILLVGGGIVLFQTGVPTPAIPGTNGMFLGGWTDLTIVTAQATVAQLAMTLGNAALATSVLLSDYFDRDISADDLSTSMGVMNLTAIPFGAFPMCHGSGGVAGKYSFGARTAGANVILGVGYITVSLLAVGLVAGYPLAMVGVILVLIGLQLARTSLLETTDRLFVVVIGGLGLLTNLGVAFIIGILGWSILQRWDIR